MKLLRTVLAYGRVLPRARRNRTDLVRRLVRRPALGAAVAVYETALFVSGRVDGRLKGLAQLRASTRIGCPF